MKVLGVFLFAVICLCFSFCPVGEKSFFAYAQNLNGEGFYKAYVQTKPEGALDVQNLGVFYELTGSLQEIQKLKNTLGEAVILHQKQPNLTAVLKAFNARVVQKDGQSIYAYTPYLSRYIVQKSQKINLQIYFAKEYTAIGSPVLLGSY